MNYVFSYNPNQCHGYDFAYKLVKELKKQGFKAESYMGISQMRVSSDAPKKDVDRIVEAIK